MLARALLGRGHPAGWPAAALIVLAAGYADLWRGGIDAAPVLLVLGYCVLLPIAILRHRGARSAGPRETTKGRRRGSRARGVERMRRAGGAGARGGRVDRASSGIPLAHAITR